MLNSVKQNLVSIVSNSFQGSINNLTQDELLLPMYVSFPLQSNESIIQTTHTQVQHKVEMRTVAMRYSLCRSCLCRSPAEFESGRNSLQQRNT